MNVLFVHDHRFVRSGCKYYSNGSFPKSMWGRYTSVFESVTVVGRDGGVLNKAPVSLTLSTAKQVSFYLLPDSSNLKSFLFGNKEVSNAAAMLVREHDAVIARLPSRLGTLFVKEACKQKKPCAVEIVGCPRDAFWNYGGVKGKLFAAYAALELKLLAKNVGFALYVTETFLQSRYPAHKDAVTTFCSNVEIPSVDNSVLENRMGMISNHRLGQPIIFGLIANYSSRYKGIDVAIKALKEADLPSWQLKVLGNGDATHYEALAAELGVADKVHFIGSLPSGDPVFEWIDSIDIYLQPSLTEGLPRALAEVMSRATPALASRIGGIPELLDSSELAGAGDYKELAKKISELARRKSLQRSLAEHNFNKAKSYYKEVLDARRVSFWKQFRQHV